MAMGSQAARLMWGIRGLFAMRWLVVVMLMLGGCGGPAAGPTGTPIICNFTGGVGTTFPPDIAKACFSTDSP